MQDLNRDVLITLNVIKITTFLL